MAPRLAQPRPRSIGTAADPAAADY